MTGPDQPSDQSVVKQGTFFFQYLALKCFAKHFFEGEKCNDRTPPPLGIVLDMRNTTRLPRAYL